MFFRFNLRSAFTLIELLIVVAIIAILAAIAVPNFLEAQTRSKVSRVKSDARSMATAVESYIVDNNRLFRTARATGETRTWIMSKMTTPIAYMTSIPRSPFNVNATADPNPDDRVIVLWGPDMIADPVTGAVYAGRPVIFSPWADYSDGTTMKKTNFWVLFDVGPNQVYDVTTPWPSPMTPYDATNGTVSPGDIPRFAS